MTAPLGVLAGFYHGRGKGECRDGGPTPSIMTRQPRVEREQRNRGRRPARGMRRQKQVRHARGDLYQVSEK